MYKYNNTRTYPRHRHGRLALLAQVLQQRLQRPQGGGLHSHTPRVRLEVAWLVGCWVGGGGFGGGLIMGMKCLVVGGGGVGFGARGVGGWGYIYLSNQNQYS